MQQQQYKNHKQYYAPHHFVFLPLVTIAMIIGVYKYFTSGGQALPWLLFAITNFFILYLAIMLRQHYALNNQNRIVRLEFRLRYFQLFNRPADEVERQLTFGQIAALRFANDMEFSTLLEKALAFNLSADEIKKSIRDWQPDNMRV